VWSMVVPPCQIKQINMVVNLDESIKWFCFNNFFILVKTVSMYNDVCTRQISLMMKVIIIITIICFTFIFEKDQKLNFFISLVPNVCSMLLFSFSCEERVVKWKAHWQDFPFSCPSLKLGESFDNIFFVFSCCCHHWQLRE
jgi:hypothetical protein